MKNVIEQAIQELNEQITRLGRARTELLALSGKKNTRVMSAAGRRRISLAQKARWAKTRRAR